MTFKKVWKFSQVLLTFFSKICNAKPKTIRPYSTTVYTVLVRFVDNNAEVFGLFPIFLDGFPKLSSIYAY